MWTAPPRDCPSSTHTTRQRGGANRSVNAGGSHANTAATAGEAGEAAAAFRQEEIHRAVSSRATARRVRDTNSHQESMPKLANLRVSTWFTLVLVIACTVFLFDYLVISEREHQTRHLEGTPSLRSPSSSWHLPPPPAQAVVTLQEENKRLGVIVPAHSGDLNKAIASLARWPQKCHPLTLQHADLVLYYAGGNDDRVSSVISRLEETGGRCFAKTRVVVANLTKKENVYPKGPSVQFYKLFLDDEVRSQVTEYHALALIEWDVLVAHERSFEMLYRAAFGGVEPFWMKGSVLEGNNFHETVMMPTQRHILGHINGNAIYNNTDPSFVDFIDFTLARWEYSLSYDVALWATIADFPYSWPLWQRFSRKFVVTHLIANVGFLDVDERTVSKAVQSETLFIHGSLTGGGGSIFKALISQSDLTNKKMLLRHSDEGSELCKDACGSDDVELASQSKSTACDHTCYAGQGGARFSGLLCGAGDVEKYGGHCRMCYTNLEAARSAESVLLADVRADDEAELQHAVMCDTLLPPPPAACSAKCAMKDDTVCDSTCGTGRHGDYNCNWRGHGLECRFCFNSREAALNADAAAKRRGGRVIMCDTYEPPREVDEWAVAEQVEPTDIDLVEAEQEEEGERNDDEEELDDDNSYSTTDDELPHYGATRLFTKDITRGEMCAFMHGYHQYLGEVQATVKSVVRFMSGMTIAIAVKPNEYSVFYRTLGHLPGVKVSNTSSPMLSAVLADRYCGDGVKLIYYMDLGVMMSRTFTPKDTHSVRGDLLVLHTEVDRVSEPGQARAMVTTSVLGFHSPSFSFGTDLMLPATMNQQLRDVLLSDASAQVGKESLDADTMAIDIIADFEGVYVPEVLAALSYSRNPPGMWFINPRQWVTYHMFQHAAVWDIPLVKPRFGCLVDVSMSMQGYDVAAEMEKKLEYFVTGGDCNLGYLPLSTSSIRPKAQVEFGGPTGKMMPKIERDSVSVVYSIREADENKFFLSLTSVVEKFVDAAEVVVVFRGTPSNRDALQDVIDAVEEGSDVPIRTVEDTEALKNGGEPSSRLRSGEYCRGKYVLHLNPTEVIVEDITYDHIFHFKKPVMPYGRYEERIAKGSAVARCTAEAMTKAFDMPAVHDFGLSATIAYPKKAYRAFRDFIEGSSGLSLEQYIQTNRMQCNKRNGKNPRIPVGEFEVNLMGTYLWHNMRDSMHWRATHALDLDAYEWLSDVRKYNFACDLSMYALPQDEGEGERFIEAAQDIRSRDDCTAFQNRHNF